MLPAHLHVELVHLLMERHDVERASLPMMMATVVSTWARQWGAAMVVVLLHLQLQIIHRTMLAPMMMMMMGLWWCRG